MISGAPSLPQQVDLLTEAARSAPSDRSDMCPNVVMTAIVTLRGATRGTPCAYSQFAARASFSGPRSEAYPPSPAT